MGRVYLSYGTYQDVTAFTNENRLMSPTKSELEWNQQEYYSRLRRAKAAINKQCHQDAVNEAALALHHVDGMMQFERRYENTVFDRIEAIDIILVFAPMLLDLANLELLAAVLKNQKRIDKNTSVDLAIELDQARQLLWDSYRIWSLLEVQQTTWEHEIHEKVEVSRDRVRALLDHWVAMQLVRRKREPNDDCVFLVTHFSAPCVGKCPTCGASVTREKIALLVDSDCQACGVAVGFVILDATPADNN